jgi:hypothetical protein
LLLQAAVVVVVLVLSLVKASACWEAVAAAGCSGDRRAGALLGGKNISLVSVLVLSLVVVSAWSTTVAAAGCRVIVVLVLSLVEAPA